ncbi:MAG: ABC transporter permease [Sphaerochaeta sp.]|jgi:spermidine/putrescine transport system permease protein|uniref:Inner membrane ABC transporter permease protein YdcV n=2 Tax=root TaxID=1 RepID=A0A644XPG8_9ZZZZ|nr:ABC transporter permease [Sphaerochaeta sp.]MDD2395364.1 ABC transporter permease [Sphaerochaeta sp.]MDD3423662.1 ABC transporter permease [Sphaerochaeta sp.]MDD4450102.1 ABC transporter permease [Sphaerochaeta sp.]NLA97453.1 ABC transporter permease [Spirochaetales bacterium]
MNYHKYQSKSGFSFSYVMLALVVVFLFIPLFVVVFFSFNSAKGMQWDHASLIWYKTLIFNSPSLWAAFKNSLIIALTSAVTATALGSLAAIGIKWYRFHGRSYITTVSYLPMVLPEVIIGISMLIFFSAVKVRLGMFTIFAAHTTFNLPFVFMMVTARLDEFDYSTVEAARDLGANERQTLTKVIIPSIIPAVLSGFLMCITMSLEDFVITFFVSGPGSGTLPLYVYSMIRYGVSPVINALSFVMILGTMIIAFTFRKFLKTVAASS